jgi:hypothetical protein
MGDANAPLIRATSTGTRTSDQRMIASRKQRCHVSGRGTKEGVWRKTVAQGGGDKVGRV